MKCATPSCENEVAAIWHICGACHIAGQPGMNDIVTASTQPARRTADIPMSVRYPKYYKSVQGRAEIDIYATCQIFNVNDPSGALQHAIKKLLLPGTRTGGKSRYDDIKEARDTLNRWLELHTGDAPKTKE